MYSGIRSGISCGRLVTRRAICNGVLIFWLTLLILVVKINLLNDEPLVASDHTCPHLQVTASIQSHAVAPISCLALMEGDEKETSKALLHMQFNPYRKVSPKDLERVAENCHDFKLNNGYDAFPVTKEEREFPLAFSILVHRDVDQMERLLRVIYRSHNFYCIHVDANSGAELLRAVTAVSRCFSNVFLPKRLEPITYAHFSRLRADLNCMEELILRGGQWKYLINLTGQMFPLKTNLEIVKILQTYDGSNDIEGMSRYVSVSMKARYEHSFDIVNKKLVNSHRKKEEPPHGITLVKGSAYGAFTRPFVEYVLADPIVKDFLNWTSDIYSPDEFFWASLNSRWVNPMFKSPGGHDLPPERKPWLAAYAAWRKKDDCRGQFVRNICIFGVGDLPSLIGRKELFANKFYADFQYLAVDCIVEWLWNKTQHRLPIDLEFYRNVKRLLRQT